MLAATLFLRAFTFGTGNYTRCKLRVSGSAADDYARDIVDSAVAAAGSRAVVAKLVADLTTKGVSEATIQAKMAELLKIATEQVKAAG